MTILAGERPPALSPETLAAAYRARRIRNQSLVPAVFPMALSPARREALEARLARLGRVPPDEDLRPAAYLLTWRAWLVKFVSPMHFLGLAALAGAALWALGRLWSARRAVLGSAGSAAALCLGASAMGLEVSLLLGFQSASGALYWKLGALFAAFMAGTAAGAAIAARVQAGRRALAALLCGLAAFELAVQWRLPGLAALSPESAFPAFAALLAANGLAVGLGYPWACRVAAAGEAAGPRAPGAVYAADLWGSALGAFLVSGFAVPLWGLRASLAACAAVLAPAVAALALEGTCLAGPPVERL